MGRCLQGLDISNWRKVTVLLVGNTRGQLCDYCRRADKFNEIVINEYLHFLVK